MSSSTEEADDRYRAPALDKGLDILELLASTEESLSQAEIAKALAQTPNEVYRMLERLVRRRYIARTSDDRYELTLKLFGLAHQHAPMRRLVSQAMPELRAFAREAGQACHLAIYDRGSVVVVAQVDPPGYWAFSVRVGSHVGLFNTGSGHVLLAFASPREREFMIQEHEMLPGERRPRDFKARLDLVRQRGYELMTSQQTSAVQNLSAPVLGPNGTIVAVLTCPFILRLDTTSAPSLERVLEMLRDAARKLSPVAGGAD
jgi:DNA-binding IclR family transcriptional regulator